jgi:hypothetical protein
LPKKDYVHSGKLKHPQMTQIFADKARAGLQATVYPAGILASYWDAVHPLKNISVHLRDLQIII